MLKSLMISRFILFCLVSSLLMGCYTGAEQINYGIQGFDITPDGKHIVFCWLDNHKTSLYKANIDGTNVKLLVSAADNLSSNNPICSSDGQKIVFLRSAPKSLKSAVWMVNIAGDGLKQLTDSNTLKIEAVFSQNDESIYYTQANEYAAYSVVGRKAPHNFDVYNLSLKTMKVSKVSDLKAYWLYDLKDADSLKLLFSLRDEKSGIFFFNKKDSVLTRVVTTNDTLRNSEGYSKPILLNSGKIICASYYELVSIDLEQKKETLLMASGGSHFSVIRHNKLNHRIFYQKTDDNEFIHSDRKSVV